MSNRCEGIPYVHKDDYPGLPDELKKFNYYYDDGETGHVIMAVPECLLDDADECDDFDCFQFPIPVKYILKKGYRIYNNHIICDVICIRHETDEEYWFELKIDNQLYEI